MSKIALLDCVNGNLFSSDTFPYIVGTDPDVDCRVTGNGINGKHCSINNNGYYVIQSLGGNIGLSQQPAQEVRLEPGIVYPLTLGSRCFLITATNDPAFDANSLNSYNWNALYNNSEVCSSMPLPQLLGVLSGTNAAADTLIYPDGCDNFFKYQDLLNDQNSATMASSSPQAAAPKNSGPKNAGAHTCPWCWWRFDSGDLKWVANHPALKGDPLLGQDAYLRFLPNRYSGHKALDSKGNECSEVACPHCHNVVPMSMLRMPQHLISLVGDAQSGKSYYMTVMAKVLGDALATYFDGTFEDATPGANATIRDMIRAMFGALSLQDGMRLQKTKLDGEMYHRIKRNGEDRQVLLPKPFIFSSSSKSSKGLNLVFYDNAGEHFQPGTDSSENPSAQHVASASGIMFLFDPFNNIDFRRAMHRDPTGDPQFQQQVTGDVVAIMSEMKNRITKITGSDRFKSPVAFLVGKYDAWGKALLPEGQQFYEVKEKGRLSWQAIHHNSELTKSILEKACPAVCRLAQDLSDEVLFFPVSSFGAPATKIEYPDGSNATVCDPAALNPFLVEAPVLWLMNKFDPRLVPCS